MNDDQAKGMLVLFAQTDARVQALQFAIERMIPEERRDAFSKTVQKHYQIALENRIENVEDTDPVLAIELQRIVEGLTKDE